MHLWVRIETETAGIITGLAERVGWGPSGDRHHPGAELANKLIGRCLFAIDAIFEELRRSLLFEGGFAGALITALTPLEIALWDSQPQGAEGADLRTAGRQVPR